PAAIIRTSVFRLFFPIRRRDACAARRCFCDEAIGGRAGGAGRRGVQHVNKSMPQIGNHSSGQRASSGGPDLRRDASNGHHERLFPPIEVMERPVSERPQHETLEGIIDWLASPASQLVPSLIGEFDEFAWRMLAAGFPLLRATLVLRTLHPQYLGATF